MTSHHDQSAQFRYVLIGCAAGIAKTHLQALKELPEARVVGMSDINAERGAERAAEWDCPFFVDHQALLAATQPDIAVITTPHPFHAPIALDCFAAGAHVLVEKPLAVEVAEADRMIAAADAAGRVLAVSFQQRFRPVIEHARALIEQGVVGDLVRTLCIEPWYRPAAYFRSASWRGTWAGEGGGILMNQAPHNMDLFCHLAGLPTTIWGWTRTLCHAIECEDTAQAMLEYPNGAPGYLTMSTTEAGGQGRMEIVGDRGAMHLVGDQLTVIRFDTPASEFRETSPDMYSAPGVTSEVITLPGTGGGHLAVYRDLQAAISENRPPRIDGRQGRMSLELSNAIILSSHRQRPVTLPLDREEYSKLLEELRAGSRFGQPTASSSGGA